jgi:hypothetical protein
MTDEQTADPDDGVNPAGFKGSRSTGYVCRTCGAEVRGGTDQWWRLHRDWHERHGS